MVEPSSGLADDAKPAAKKRGKAVAGTIAAVLVAFPGAYAALKGEDDSKAKKALEGAYERVIRPELARLSKEVVTLQADIKRVESERDAADGALRTYMLAYLRGVEAVLVAHPAARRRRGAAQASDKTQKLIGELLQRMAKRQRKKAAPAPPTKRALPKHLNFRQLLKKRREKGMK